MSCLVNITYINDKKYQYYQQIPISVLKSKYSNLREFQNIIQRNNVEFNNFFGQKTYINFEIWLSYVMPGSIFPFLRQNRFDYVLNIF